MKNKLSLILTLTTPLLLLNCSAKKPESSPHIVKNPTPSSNTEPTQPSLGRPISVSSPTQSTLPVQRIPVQQTSKHGISTYTKKFKLTSKIKETSGLIKIDNKLWTLNDSGDKAKIYRINERNGQILKTLNITNAGNYDWEDIAYDDNYVYIGDFGNNRGNRRELKVYKIPRASLRTQKSVRAEVINFKYNDQKDFSSKPHKNNYDCEAMVAHNDKLYLFSKNWENQKTRLYELSTNAGNQIARYKSTFNIDGMVTGASLNKELDILLLTTYSSLLNVNIWAFTNYRRGDFFSGNAKRLNFQSPLQAQVEGVTFTGNYKAYFSSEAFRKYIFSFDASLYELDFSGEFE